ncbi:MAG TPA: hypothetical protein VMT99_01580 [Candidatus Paceibacterota bacterium]|nr:hypothetical protein [Candidatus Paceibacterota bacterium]
MPVLTRNKGYAIESSPIFLKDADRKTYDRSPLTLADGYIEDFVSGLAVKATQEEIEAVQVFSKQLVEDYGYPRDVIQTRPQFRVKIRL